MQRSYIDYAMTVIVSRALPDVRDGLKPVHRRVLYAMYDGGYRPDRGYYKCSRVVGDVMGQYHPHGDSSIYDALVRLAQPWSLRYPLVDGQGNFGSPGQRPGGRACDTPSAGWRRSPWRWSATSTRRPSTSRPTTTAGRRSRVVLPSRFPNLLVNGSAGIAVGMATNIPPHNLREVAAGVQWSLENPEAPREELLEALIEPGPGPGLPDRRADHGPQGHRGRLPHRPRLDHHARGGRGRGDPEPPVPGRHRAALPGQPRQPGAEDRRAGQGRQDRRHRRRPATSTSAAPASAW